MRNQGKKDKLHILCGLSSEAGGDTRNALMEAAERLEYEAVCVSRYRKEGIRQYVDEHSEFRTLVLQEAMQSSYPYQAEELAELMDDYHLNIVISINRSHRGKPYTKVLYTAGILNALYEEDATTENILRLMLSPRTRREAREYYQISTAEDAMRSLDVVNEERMQGYASYIEESQDGQEMLDKYRHVAKSLKIIENIYLISHFPRSVNNVLASDGLYQEINALREKKRHWPFRRKDFPKGLKGTGGCGGGTLSRAPADKREKEALRDQHIEEHEIVEMIDEDISDLLGFDTEEKDLGFHPKKAQWAGGEDPQGGGCKAKGEKERKNGKLGSGKRGMLFRGLILGGIACFIAIAILFGLFLHLENQKRETSAPVVSALEPTKSARKERPEIPKKVKEGAPEQMQPKVKEGGELQNNAAQASEEVNANRQEDVGTKPAVTEAPETGDQEPETQVRREMNQPDAQQDPPQPTAAAPAFDVSVEESASAPSDPAPERLAPYQGSILTGAEVIRIARLEESNGNRLYLKTREAGEGFFSAEAISQMVDGDCSYLTQGVTGGQLSFIQQ